MLYLCGLLRHHSMCRDKSRISVKPVRIDGKFKDSQELQWVDAPAPTIPGKRIILMDDVAVSSIICHG